MGFQFERRELGRAKIGIVTITAEEFDQARRVFRADTALLGTPYFIAAAENEQRPAIVLCQASARSNIPAYQTASRLLEAWRPEYIFLTGTAGGVKQKDGGKESERLELGDVVVANYIDYVEYAKLTADGIAPRRIAYDHPSTHLRTNFVTSVIAEKRWQERIDCRRPDEKKTQPRVHVGNVAAGEKIFADYAGEHQIKLLELFEKAIAFEMESYGVAVLWTTTRSS
jgi:nucleoside phosphorylase